MTTFGASRSRYDDVRCVDSVRRGVNSTCEEAVPCVEE